MKTLFLVTLRCYYKVGLVISICFNKNNSVTESTVFFNLKIHEINAVLKYLLDSRLSFALISSKLPSTRALNLIE